jgi:predicted PurR-regulated permease PerM
MEGARCLPVCHLSDRPARAAGLAGRSQVPAFGRIAGAGNCAGLCRAWHRHSCVDSRAGPKLQSESRKLISAVPTWIEQLSTGKIVWQVGSEHGWSRTTQEHLQNWIAEHRGQLLLWAEHLGNHVAQLVVKSIWLIIVPIVAVFLLRDGGDFADSLIEILDRRRQRQFLSALLNDLDTMLARYIRAQLILAAPR